jgi:hypothetical protein
MRVFRWLGGSTFYIYPYGDNVGRYTFNQHIGTRGNVCVMEHLSNVEELE